MCMRACARTCVRVRVCGRSCLGFVHFTTSYAIAAFLSHASKLTEQPQVLIILMLDAWNGNDRSHPRYYDIYTTMPKPVKLKPYSVCRLVWSIQTGSKLYFHFRARLLLRAWSVLTIILHLLPLSLAVYNITLLFFRDALQTASLMVVWMFFSCFVCWLVCLLWANW